MYRYLILCLIPFLFSCNQQKKIVRDTITVSIIPQKYILQKLAGDHFKINVMVPDGSGPETYEPTAAQMKELNSSSVYFVTGLLDFEKSWVPKIGEMYPELSVVNTSAGVNLIKGHEEHHSNHNHGIDPHIWLSLNSLKAQAQIMLNKLIETDSANKILYSTNFKKLVLELDSVDSLIREKYLKTGQQISFLIYHPSLSYYARDYGVEQIPIEIEGKEPSASYMKGIMDIAKKKNIKAVFYSAQFDKRSAETIARQLNIPLIPFNPLQENVEQNLLNITDIIIHDSQNE